MDVAIVTYFGSTVCVRNDGVLTYILHILEVSLDYSAPVQHGEIRSRIVELPSSGVICGLPVLAAV